MDLRPAREAGAYLEAAPLALVIALEVRPGLTGWAQIHGRASLPWPERIELDVWYVEHRSLRLDASILARTAGVLFRRDFVYRGEAGGWR